MRSSSTSRIISNSYSDPSFLTFLYPLYTFFARNSTKRSFNLAPLYLYSFDFLLWSSRNVSRSFCIELLALEFEESMIFDSTFVDEFFDAISISGYASEYCLFSLAKSKSPATLYLI